MSFSTHPNPALHDSLVEASKSGNFTAEKLKGLLGLHVPPKQVSGAEAYINWATTVDLLIPRPALEWFAGVSRSPQPPGIWRQSPDKVRDTHSEGIWYTVKREEIVKNLDEVFYFTVWMHNGLLFVDVFDKSGNWVALVGASFNARCVSISLSLDLLYQFDGKSISMVSVFGVSLRALERIFLLSTSSAQLYAPCFAIALILEILWLRSMKVFRCIALE
ncbi:hypothetical protein M422DRAFT_53548 [Sphaerobolus stellatus SS14]|uniref:Uncharacterized protein n=1 Tax=Sphaerobolus stellatus (strain SS14) TaxID=990650 RepID=A0A0C9V0T0_SPHS4|nr:hypothetical protein M422DRAFT_53548 [Sphaerobolus stellatus SS14]